jgi:hypothetical protein
MIMLLLVLVAMVREQPGVQTAAETLTRGTGSCRDFANLFMGGRARSRS